MALRRYQHKFLQPLEIDQERVSSSLNTNLTTTNLTVTNSNVTTQTVSKLSTNNFFNSATPDYTPSVETLTVFGDPNVSQGAIAHIRNNNVSVNDANVFGGLKFSSSPGADFIIGKSTQLGSGFLQVRRETGTVNLSMDGFGNVTLNTGNLVIGTSGKGIDFSANANAAGMTSELLTDYEEGTFTPTISASSTNPTITYGSERVGRYIKVGNMVNVWIVLSTTARTGGAGNLQIDLPFTATNVTNMYMAGSIGTIYGVTHSSTFAQFGTRVNPSTTNAYLWEFGTQGGSTTDASLGIGVIPTASPTFMTLFYSYYAA